MTSHPLPFGIARTCIALVFCALLAAARTSQARESGAEHAQRARVAYDLRDWDTAAREFRSAYENESKSEYLFGLAQALRQAHDYPAAIFTFKAYKRSEGITAQQATAAELLITQCEAEQAKLDAQVVIQQANAARAVSATAPAEPSPAGAGAPGLSGTAPDWPAPAPASASAARATAPADVPRASAPFHADVWGDVLFVAGLGAAGVGTGLLLSGNAEMRDSAGRATEGQAASAADDARSRQALGSALCPVGGALLVGAVWRWIAISADSVDTPVVETVSVGPRSIALSGTF